MPSKSKKQARTMRAAAHNKDFADKMDIPQDVARDYVEADQNAGSYGSSRKKRGNLGAIKA